ncbi:MAG: hypothetical protein ABJ013_10455 [Halioglobus sp.]
MPEINRLYSALGLILSLLASSSVGAEELCATKGENYIQDADFALEAADVRARFWGRAQHAGERSFTATFEEDVLTIEKVDIQPWYYFRQFIDAEDLQGKTLAFTAEMELNLTEPEVPAFDVHGGGLYVAVSSSSRKVLLRSELENEPRIGKTDWIPMQYVFKVHPRAKTIEVAFAHIAEGSMRVRHPSLKEVNLKKPECELP